MLYIIVTLFNDLFILYVVIVTHYSPSYRNLEIVMKEQELS